MKSSSARASGSPSRWRSTSSAPARKRRPATFRRARDRLMNRRAFIASSLLAASVVARAQQASKVYHIGILEAVPAAQNTANLDALRRGLRGLGYVEGRNLIIDYRSAD